VIDIIANIGVVGKQLDGIQEKNLDMSDLLDSSISAITDTDLVTAMSELSNVTTAIQASYYLVSQLKNNSLVRYLN
jgi:flagellin-like hook-associated protein FlgL